MSELDTDYVTVKRWLARGLRLLAMHLEESQPPPRADIQVHRVSRKSITETDT